MTPRRKQRLIMVVFMLLGVSIATALALKAFNENMMFFYSPTEIKAGKAPVEQDFRLGGLVVDGSVRREPNSLTVLFDLTDNNEVITVRYDKILPDLFREGQGIIARGQLNKEGVVIAIEVLAKHDENYMPPEVSDALAKSEGNKE
ncbi:MAG: cytochrome c maturation protein CcmE [Methylophaga sp.]|nr:cytochrome c maturation protein CcmE [Methylophaga sp.]